ncbi:hypothetical protein DFH28DRAFT_1131031 [Melampsora americana]|nr:hypothetical protein DFH28DRAFT_1131031 [Melampsora americana]
MAPCAMRDSMELDASLDEEDDIVESSEHENKNIMPSATVLETAAHIEELESPQLIFKEGEDSGAEIEPPRFNLKDFDDFEEYKAQQHPNNLQYFLHANSPDFSPEINMLPDIHPSQQAPPPQQSIKHKAKEPSPTNPFKE